MLMGSWYSRKESQDEDHSTYFLTEISCFVHPDFRISKAICYWFRRWTSCSLNYSFHDRPATKMHRVDKLHLYSCEQPQGSRSAIYDRQSLHLNRWASKHLSHLPADLLPFPLFKLVCVCFLFAVLASLCRHRAACRRALMRLLQEEKVPEK